MHISLEKIISLVVQEVVRELKKNGITVVSSQGSPNASFVNSTIVTQRNKSELIDMSKYKTPILTENHINRLHELTGEVVVPKGTIITPKARELIRQKNITLSFK